MTQGEEKEVEEDFGDGYFAQYQKGIQYPPLKGTVDVISSDLMLIKRV